MGTAILVPSPERATTGDSNNLKMRLPELQIKGRENSDDIVLLLPQTVLTFPEKGKAFSAI